MSRRTLHVLCLLGFTYDDEREAYRLRSIGHRWGPVFVPERTARPAART